MGISPCHPTPLDLHTNNQSSCIILRGIPLKIVVQEAQKEAKKWIISQRPSEVPTYQNKKIKKKTLWSSCLVLKNLNIFVWCTVGISKFCKEGS